MLCCVCLGLDWLALTRPYNDTHTHTQRTKWKEDLRSIQPINGGNNSSGGVLDRFGNRDISRCVLAPCASCVVYACTTPPGLLLPVADMPAFVHPPPQHSADAMPVEVDQAIDWDSVGGLREHITALKEMVMFPLLYPEYFQRFSVTPPRCVRSGPCLALGVCTPVGAGLNPYSHPPPFLHCMQSSGVLFYGPPGTGKTLMARALASTCSKVRMRPKVGLMYPRYYTCSFQRSTDD